MSEVSDKISYINGQFLPHDKCLIHIDDRGFQFADGVYEVTLLKDGRLIDGFNHIERLFRSLKELDILHNFTHQFISDIQLQLFAKNNINNGFCYLNVTRGVHSRIQNQPSAKPTINAIVTVIDDIDDQSLQPINVISHQDLRWLRCDIKSVGLCASSMIKQKALDYGASDAIMIRGGFITEATYANIFMVDNDNNLITRACDNLILCGITRNRIIDIAKKNNINVIEKDFGIEELKKAREVFLTSSTLLIRPVAKIDQDLVNEGRVGNITRDLYDFYQDFMRSYDLSCQ